MKDIFTEILNAIKKESRRGYGDTSVFGGFYVFVKEKLGKEDYPHKDQVLELLKGYGDSPLTRRKDILASVGVMITVMAAADAEKEKEVKAELTSLPPEPPPLQYVKGVGPKRVSFLKKLGIENVHGLVEYFPRRHEDRREIIDIGRLSPGENSVIRGYIKKVESHRLKKNLEITKAFISDDTGSVTAVWFNQGWLKDQLKADREIVAYGRSDFRYGKRQFTVAEFTFPDEHQGGFGILPVYSLTQGMSQKLLRTIIHNALEMEQGKLIDFLPDYILQKYNLPSREWAVNQYHFPDNLEELQDARRRVVFDELFLLRVATDMEKGIDNAAGVSQKNGSLDDFQQLLPFTLTNAQNRVIAEVYQDMASPTRMMRLVEGDVGSGKTAVAAAAAYRCWRSGYQCALMAPTEILAQQHYKSMSELFKDTPVTISLLTGSMAPKVKREIYENLADGSIDLLIGTHALVEAKTRFKDLSTVIIDEQHRFGVGQRENLAAKGRAADTLILTATPIPRTLAMTVFADLSLSILDEMPPGRQKVKTAVLSPKEEMRALNFIKKQAEEGYQSYIVCPLVEDSEELDLASATDLYDRLTRGVFREVKVGLVHGKMKPDEKREVMEKFRTNEISVLISTTVIEVGVDVANATVMLIRDAHRFGLAQLHQMRGRIGRGKAQSYCILEHGGQGETAKRRLEVMVKYDDGFKIAEEDLAIRGPGDFFGTRQHGVMELKVADLYVDHEALAAAAECAGTILKDNPDLAGDEWRILRYILKNRRRIF